MVDVGDKQNTVRIAIDFEKFVLPINKFITMNTVVVGKKKPNENYTKAKIEREYPSLNVRQRKATLNTIIARVRKVSIKVAGQQKKLRPIEVDLFREEWDDKYYRL